jgi:CHAT domain-containing protein/tetratricopeptide (TPR) repeat protein
MKRNPKTFKSLHWGGTPVIRSSGFLLMLVVCLSIFPPSDPANASPSTPDELYSQGLNAYHAGNFEEALGNWQAGLKAAESQGSGKLVSIFSANIGLAYAGMNDYPNAVLFYEKALQTNMEAGDLRNAAINMNNLGVLYKDRGHYETALKYFQDALAIRREAGDHRGAANTLNNMGVACSESGRYRDAFAHIREALGICEAIKDHRGRIDALINLGVVYTDVGQYPEALDAYQKAAELNQVVNNPKKQADISGNIGTVHLLREDYPKALDQYRKSLEIQREINNQNGIANDLSNMGVAYRRMGHADKALQSYNEALAIKRSLGDKPREAAILGNIGLLHDASGQYREALGYLAQCHEITAAFDLPEYHWRGLRGIGKVKAALGKHEDAIQHYLQAVDAIEKMRQELAQKEMKTSFMESRMHVYDELIEIYMLLHRNDPEKGYDRQSFEIFERKQGRVFLEEMGKSGVRYFSGIPGEVVETESRLTAELQKTRAAFENAFADGSGKNGNGRIQRLREQAEGFEKQLQNLKETIKTRYPDYYALKYPQPVALAYLQQSVLAPDEILLVYNVMEDQSGLWVIGKDHFSMHRLAPGRNSMTEMVTAFRDNDINIFKGQTLRGASDTPASGEKPSSGPALYQSLFPEPVPEIIQKASTIYIIPTGALYLLPFEALKDETNQYLIASHNFAYLSSASLLNVLRVAKQRRGMQPLYPFLAFANPVYDVPKEINDTVDELQVRSFYSLMRGAIDPLPETEDEVTLIKNILKAPEKSKPLQIRENASRSVVFNLNSAGTLHDYRYISFACHGLIPDEINGVTQPALLLSTPDPFSKEIGLLTMSDVFGLKLNADLVALSACNTARGEIVKGEGMIGLTRSFMYAGTPSICVNLWAVETVSAQKLSVAFFQNLEKGNHRAEALRESKLKLLRGEAGKQFQSPFFWAPMILFGDGS